MGSGLSKLVGGVIGGKWTTKTGGRCDWWEVDYQNWWEV